jgi:hypothetical protein
MSIFGLYNEKCSKAKKRGRKYDHPPSAAATIEGLAFLRRFSREPSLLGGEDV